MVNKVNEAVLHFVNAKNPIRLIHIGGTVQSWVLPYNPTIGCKACGHPHPIGDNDYRVAGRVFADFLYSAVPSGFWSGIRDRMAELAYGGVVRS